MPSRFGASPMLLGVFLLAAVSVSGFNPTRKLDETIAPGTGEVKCGSCSTPAPPPPPPPAVPCPPPPYQTPNPPPSPKKPQSSYGPPPPPSYIYITGPPGDLYPIDNNGGAKRTTGLMPALVGCAFLGLFMAV